jgi:chromosome segregation ATPase
MKIKLLTAVCGSKFSRYYGEILDSAEIDLTDDQAREWIALGMAQEVPEGEAATATLAEQASQIATLTSERDGLQRELADSKASLAEAKKTAEGAKAESASLRKSLDEASAAKTAAEKELKKQRDITARQDDAVRQAKAALDAMKADLATVAAERDALKAQAPAAKA